MTHFPWDTGNFVILSFSHVFKTSRLFLALCFACARGPQRPVDVAKYHILRRRRSHVFLALCFAQREYRGGTPFIQRVYSAQAGEQVPGSQNEVSGNSFFQTLCSALCEDRGRYSRLHLVLEHHVLRRMNDGGRCIMSEMEPASGMSFSPVTQKLLFLNKKMKILLPA